MSTIVLIAGASRGLGKGMPERYLALPSHTVIAANWNPDHPSSKELSNVPNGEGSKLLVVKLDATVCQDAFDAVQQIEAQAIEHLDVVVANAGVAYVFPTVAELQEKDLEAHLRPNSMALGPGWVHTDLGDIGAAAFNVDAETQAKLMISVETSCDGMFKVLNETTKEKHGGKMVLFSGETAPW